MVVILTVFLAAAHVLGPVAGVGLLVVQEPANAELLSCCAWREQCENVQHLGAKMPPGWLYRLLGILTVPAGPVARAGSLVAKDAVEPVAVLSALWRIWGVGC